MPESGVRARSARARSPELIAVKIRAPSSPFEPFRNVTRLVEPAGRRRRPGAMSMMSRPAALAALVLVLAACSSSGASSAPPAASGAPSSPPSGAPSASPEHCRRHRAQDRADRRDPPLRGGRRVHDRRPGPRRQAPAFTLYGDGTIIFRNTIKEALPAVGSVMPLHPFRTAKMNEEQIQTLLEFALGEGGLGAARAEYLDMMVSDASTAVFTVNAGGLAKTVSVYALGLEHGRDARSARRARPWRSCATISSTSTRAARSRPTSTRPSAIARSCSRASPAPRTRRPGRGRTSRPPSS